MALNLSIRADVEDIARASQWLAQAGAELGVPDSQVRRLDQCLDELLANVVHHGGAQAAASDVRLTLAVSDAAAPTREATLTVDDAGPAFDPTTHQTKALPEDLMDAEPGGLGIMMVREFSDRLVYRYVNGRNCLDVTVNWVV
jgi:anti-sigma regulatory factor (Ser/Thr protein kinase)